MAFKVSLSRQFLKCCGLFADCAWPPLPVDPIPAIKTHRWGGIDLRRAASGYRDAFIAIAGSLLLLTCGLHAQAVIALPSLAAAAPAAAPAAGLTENAPSLESMPPVPGIANVFKGFNAGLSYASVHNSTIGWYSVATPALSYAFSSHYSADVSSSIYFKRKYLTYLPTDPPRQRWVDEATDAGDTLLGFHASFTPGPFEEMLTGTLSAPTGDAAAGLGTGRVNFDFTNHTEYFRRQMGLFLDLGVGNSSGLFNNMVERNYSTSGGLAHFLVGAEDWIGNRVFVESLLYEQLPFGTQTVLAEPALPGTMLQPNKASRSAVNEDNGITTYLSVPVSGNLALSGYYSRSLRQHSDTVSVGFNWVLKGRTADSMVDRALEEAEKPAKGN